MLHVNIISDEVTCFQYLNIVTGRGPMNFIWV